MNCRACTAETTNGLALCDLCQTKLSADLEYLPVYFRNLARWRPGRAGSRPVPGYREPRAESAVATDRVSRTLDEGYATVAGWLLCLADDRAVEVPPPGDDEGTTFAAMCRVLSEHLTSVATLEWCGELVRQARRLEHQLRTLTEAIAPGWYAGACRSCAAPTYVIPGLSWATCRSCGATTYARDHLDLLLEEARPWVARPRRIAEVVVAFTEETDVHRLHGRITAWGVRGRIASYRALDRDGDEVGPRSYRFGDVLDVLATERFAPSLHNARKVG